jgi:hypothetical protein
MARFVGIFSVFIHSCKNKYVIVLLFEFPFQETPVRDGKLMPHAVFQKKTGHSSPKLNGLIFWASLYFE